MIYAYNGYNLYTYTCMFDTWLNSLWPVSLATNDNICSSNKLPAEKGKHSHNLIRMTNRVLIMTNIGQEWQRNYIPPCDNSPSWLASCSTPRVGQNHGHLITIIIMFYIENDNMEFLNEHC